MANPDHLEKLCQGPKVWNTWRQENPHVTPDLSQATLGLNQRQFGPSNGGPIDLRAANLEGAMLRFATLTGADLEGARLTGADLMHARLDRAKLIAADLTDAMLDHADLTGADFTRAVIIGASFINARNLTQVQIEPAYGDASTLLPATLMPPQDWFPAVEEEEVFSEYRAPAEQEEEDLYELLGVQKTATADEIRSAHRNLVKKLHPDVNPDDPDAQELFKKVSSSYRILSDQEKRAAYNKGEIDSQGRSRPAYEAQQQFRKYAFRFYAAAVLSMFLATGALLFAWNAVLRNHGDHRATAAVAAPQKQYEKLAAKAEAPAAKAENAAAAPNEKKPRAKVDAARDQSLSGPPGNGKALKAANNDPGPSPKTEAGAQQKLSIRKEVSAGPLGDQHTQDEADRVQSPSARVLTPESRPETAAAPSGQASGLQMASQPAPGHGEAGTRPVITIVPKAGGDFVTTLFSKQAIEQASAKSEPQTTASIDTGSPVRPEAVPSAPQQNPGTAKQHRRAGPVERRERRVARRTPRYVITDDGEEITPREALRLERLERLERMERMESRERLEQREAVSDDVFVGGSQ